MKEGLIHALVTANAILYGLTKYQSRKLQQVLNATARLGPGAHKLQ